MLALGLAIAVAAGVIEYRIAGPYGPPDDSDPRVRRIYEPATGRLKLIVFDASGRGRFDTWAYMDGDRMIRMDVDSHGDGYIDRREYYDDNQHLLRTEYLAADGHVIRVEPGRDD
jgi:hypothetical protein